MYGEDVILSEPESTKDEPTKIDELHKEYMPTPELRQALKP